MSATCFSFLVFFSCRHNFRLQDVFFLEEMNYFCKKVYCFCRSFFLYILYLFFADEIPTEKTSARLLLHMNTPSDLPPNSVRLAGFRSYFLSRAQRNCSCGFATRNQVILSFASREKTSESHIQAI